jgi:cardiolipin synthase
VQRFNPTRWYTLEESNYRTHRKLLIVDGAVGFTGGIGIADHWLPEPVEPDAKAGTFWRDTHIRLTGPVVERLEAAFYENFAETADVTTPYLLHASDVQAPPAGSHEGEAFVVRSASSGGSSDLKRLYLMALAMARRTVDIASPYFITDESVMWALESAVARGVVIRVLVEGDMTDALPVKYASRHAYDQLLSKGIAIHEYQPTMMHAKVFVVDGVWSMFGSANFDNRSLELNDELNVAVHSPALAAQLLDDFEHDLTRATRLELSRWRQRPMRDKFREYVWSYFGEVF